MSIAIKSSNFFDNERIRELLSNLRIGILIITAGFTGIFLLIQIILDNIDNVSTKNNIFN